MARKRKLKGSVKVKKHSSKHKNKESSKLSSYINKNNNISIKTNTEPQDIEENHTNVTSSAKTFYPCQSSSKIFPKETIYNAHINKCVNKMNPQVTKNEELEKKEILVNILTNKEISQPIKDPTGKLFYPCLYCSKIFPREPTCKSHMDKCFNKISSQNNTQFDRNTNKNEQREFGLGESVLNKTDDVNDSNTLKIVDKSIIDQPDTAIDQDYLKDNDMEVQIIQKETPKYDLSIYDYDEDTTDEVPKNKDCRCKLCPFTADNPIEVLRHKRKEHIIPRKILSPNEIQKYFDFPDRSYCPICEKPIKTNNFKSLFVKHLLVHTVGLNFECRICKKKFRRRDQLKYHENRHIITFSELQAIQDAVYEDDVCVSKI